MPFEPRECVHPWKGNNVEVGEDAKSSTPDGGAAAELPPEGGLRDGSAECCMGDGIHGRKSTPVAEAIGIQGVLRLVRKSPGGSRNFGIPEPLVASPERRSNSLEVFQTLY
jgi:hypothetical protein